MPGDAGDFASFGIDGDYTQTGTGSLLLDVGADLHDQLYVTGNATLAGNLEVTLLGGYVPQPGDTIVAVTAGSLSGKFDNAVDRLFVNGGAFDVTYTGTSVVLSGFDASAVSPTPSPTAPGGGTTTPTWTPNSSASPTPTPNATQPAGTPSPPTPTPTPRPADVNLDGTVDGDDLDLLITRIFDGADPGAADVNGDGGASAADIPAWFSKAQE